MENQYAILPQRVKAAVIDSIVLIAAMYVISEIFVLFEEVPQYIRIGAFVLVFVVYDPFFTSAYGGTIGHSYSGISVKRANDLDKSISFSAALIRFILKAALGWISLLTISTNEKKQAIHDFAASSVVLENKK